MGWSWWTHLCGGNSQSWQPIASQYSSPWQHGATLADSRSSRTADLGVMIVDPVEMVASAYCYHHLGAEPINPIEFGVPRMAPEEGVPKMAGCYMLFKAWWVHIKSVRLMSWWSAMTTLLILQNVLIRLLNRLRISYLEMQISDLQRAGIKKAAPVEDLNRNDDLGISAENHVDHTNDEDEMAAARAALSLISPEVYAEYARFREALGYVWCQVIKAGKKMSQHHEFTEGEGIFVVSWCFVKKGKGPPVWTRMMSQLSFYIIVWYISRYRTRSCWHLGLICWTFTLQSLLQVVSNILFLIHQLPNACWHIYVYIYILYVYKHIIYYIILYHIIIYYIILYYINLYYIFYFILYYIVLYCILLYIIILYFIMLYSYKKTYHTILYYIILYYIIFYCILI